MARHLTCEESGTCTCGMCGFSPVCSLAAYHPSERAICAARAVRQLNIKTADLLLSPFDTGAEDKQACESVIVRKIAETIETHYGHISKS